jgi:hypothetical protein
MDCLHLTERGGNGVHGGTAHCLGEILLATVVAGDEGLGLRAQLTGIGEADLGGQPSTDETSLHGFYLRVRCE